MTLFAVSKKDSSVDLATYGESNYIRNLPKGTTLIRFLDEMGDWAEYYEHYDEKIGFPCTRDRTTCPGCTSPDEKVRKRGLKYATNIYFIKEDQVAPVRIPVSLARKFDNRAQRRGTITDANYYVVRSGEGLRTQYDAELDDVTDFDFTQYESKKKNINNLLKEAFDDYLEKISASEEATVEEEAKPEASDAAFDLTEVELENMTRGELNEIVAKYNIEVPTPVNNAKIIKAIVEHFEY